MTEHNIDIDSNSDNFFDTGEPRNPNWTFIRIKADHIVLASDLGITLEELDRLLSDRDTWFQFLEDRGLRNT